MVVLRAACCNKGRVKRSIRPKSSFKILDPIDDSLTAFFTSDPSPSLSTPMEKPLDHADLESFKPVREPRLGGAARHQSRLAIAALLLLTAYNQLGSKLQLSSWLPHTRPKHSLSTSAMSFYPCPDVTETLCAYHNVPLGESACNGKYE